MNSYHCSKCNKYFIRQDMYRRHLQTKLHNKEKLSYESELTCKCGKKYSHVPSLIRHKRTCLHLNPSSIKDPPPENTEEKDEMKAEILRQRSIISALESRCKDLDQLEKRCKQLEAQLEKNKTFVTIQQQGRRKLSKDTRQEVATRQEDKCNKCQTNLTKYYQIDHKTGLQFGGSDEFDNLQALCCECHAEKSILENQHRKEIQEAIQTILIKHGQ